MPNCSEIRQFGKSMCDFHSKYGDFQSSWTRAYTREEIEKNNMEYVAALESLKENVPETIANYIDTEIKRVKNSSVYESTRTRENFNNIIRFKLERFYEGEEPASPFALSQHNMDSEDEKPIDVSRRRIRWRNNVYLDAKTESVPEEKPSIKEPPVADIPEVISTQEDVTEPVAQRVDKLPDPDDNIVIDPVNANDALEKNASTLLEEFTKEEKAKEEKTAAEELHKSISNDFMLRLLKIISYQFPDKSDVLEISRYQKAISTSMKTLNDNIIIVNNTIQEIRKTVIDVEKRLSRIEDAIKE
jgi:hypothetical protein